MRPVVDVSVRDLVRSAILWPALASLPGFVACVIGDALSHDLSGDCRTHCAMRVCGNIRPELHGSYLSRAFLNSFDVDFLANVLGLGRIPGFRMLTRRAASRV